MTYLLFLFQAGTVVSLNSVLALQINDELMDPFPFPFPGSELRPTVGFGLRQSKDLRSTPQSWRRAVQVPGSPSVTHI